ncbi:hypothetical protein LTR01_008808, partial [Friedmanniomyces endolithicus]
IEHRNNHGNRRRLGIRFKVTPYLLPANIATLNQTSSAGSGARRTSEMFFPEDATEDRPRVELMAPTPAPQQLTRKLDYGRQIRRRAPAKWKRSSQGGGDEAPEASEWKKSVNGKWVTKLMRNQHIRKPAEDVAGSESSIEIPESERSASVAPAHDRTDASGQPAKTSSFPPTASHQEGSPASSEGRERKRECEGAAFEITLRKLITLFNELDKPTYAAKRCCTSCCVPITQTVRVLEDNLVDRGHAERPECSLDGGHTNLPSLPMPYHTLHMV